MNKCPRCSDPLGKGSAVWGEVVYCCADCAGEAKFEEELEAHINKLCDWSDEAEFSEFYDLSW